jgi:hypothetical protein
MPYVNAEARVRLDVSGPEPKTEGELNYCITRMVQAYLKRVSPNKPPNYALWNSVVGALECAKLEAYRRAIAPYEDTKIKENGDVY